MNQSRDLKIKLPNNAHTAGNKYGTVRSRRLMRLSAVEKMCV